MSAQGQELARAHQREQINNGALASALVLELGDELRAGRISRQEFVAAVVSAGRLSHDAANRLSVQFITAYREIEAPDREHAPPVEAAFDYGAATGRALGTLDDIDAIDPESDYDGEFARLLESLAVRANGAALNGGRATMSASAVANGTRWRRVTSSNPCSFCAMLATRSDYRTAESAGVVVGRGAGGGRARGRRPLGETFHPNCGCSVAEVLGNWQRSPEEQAQHDLYYEAREALEADGLPLTTKNIMAKMREMGDGVLSDAHKAPDAEPTSTPEARPAAAPARPRTLADMTDDELNEQMAEAMASGDWAAAEHIGELLDSRFYDGEGNRIDPADPFNDATFEWFEAQDRDTQDRFVEQMGDAWEHFGPAQYAHMHGGRTSQLPTVREMRREFEDWLDVEWIKAEEATNGNMLTHEATAAGVTIKQLWKVNANTARAWASEELLDYWNSAGRMTFADWQASYTGGESTSTLMAGAWR